LVRPDAAFAFCDGQPRQLRRSRPSLSAASAALPDADRDHLAADNRGRHFGAQRIGSQGGEDAFKSLVFFSRWLHIPRFAVTVLDGSHAFT
jgi:hypothetical protein